MGRRRRQRAGLRPRPPAARRVAFTLYELGDDIDAVERVLHAAGFPPPLCRDAARWAQQRHREAAQAAEAATSATPA